MTPEMATPIALPTCCAVDSAPETEPALLASACDSTVVVSGVMHSPWPAPEQEQAGEQGRRSAPPPVAALATASSSGRVAERRRRAPRRASTRRPNVMVSAGARSEVAR